MPLGEAWVAPCRPPTERSVMVFAVLRALEEAPVLRPKAVVRLNWSARLPW
jgi:hypothetical protein